MKTQGTKNWQNVAISTAVLLAFCFPMSGEAGVGGTGLKGFSNCLEVSTRPLSDFLDAQSIPPSSVHFPPVQDMGGWFDADFVNFGLVDYAGLANAYLEGEGISLGTTVSGRVTECKRADGTAKISVNLRTKKALGFAQSIEDIIPVYPYLLEVPTIFGATAQGVVAGADPALGPAILRTTFVIAAPGADLPNFLNVVNDPSSYEPVTLDFRSTTVGTLPDGTKARLRIQQVGATEVYDDGTYGNFIYTREIVDINKD